MDIKYFEGIVPKIIDKEIEKFCKNINHKKKPIYIDIKLANNTIINECFINVDKFVKDNGGSCVNGWVIWLHPHCLLEAEFHAVYRNGRGNLIDITPHKGNILQILF